MFPFLVYRILYFYGVNLAIFEVREDVIFGARDGFIFDVIILEVSVWRMVSFYCSNVIHFLAALSFSES